MYWRIYSIQKLWPSRRDDVLPLGNFTLYHRKQKRKVSGWLPSHHGNVEYDLKLGDPNKNGVSKISGIVHIQICKKMGRPLIKTMTKKMSTKAAAAYTALVTKSRESMALWTLAVVYPFYGLPEDIDGSFLRLAGDFSRICTRGHRCARKELIYDLETSQTVINRGLRQMGELPKAETWLTLKELVAWQQKTRWDTASKEKPAYGWVEKYKDKWSDLWDIENTKKMGEHFTKENTTIIQGSPVSSAIPKTAIVVVRSAEDAYKWKTRVDWGQLKIFRKIFASITYEEMGVGDLKPLETGLEHVYIAYAHLWSLDEWIQLLSYNIQSYTIIGRIDQYPKGRGQIFRDMCEAGRFRTEFTRHVGAEAIFTDFTVDDIPEIVKEHAVVQCFGNRHLKVDTGRVQLSRPYRLRTLRPNKVDGRDALYEERYLQQRGQPVQTTNVRSFHGVRPIAGVYICSKETASFDIHMARTVSRDALYIIGEHPCMFSFERRPPKRMTINPFV